MNTKAARIATTCAFYTLSTISVVYGEFCPDYGHQCADYLRCCGQTCCLPTDVEDHYHTHLRWSIWNMWYFWFVVLFVLMSCFGGCSYYRRHQLLMARQQSMMGNPDNSFSSWRFSPVSLFASYGGGGGRSGRQTMSMAAEMSVTGATAFPTPPPYAEVMSQPDVYPPHKDQDLPPYPGPQPMYTSGQPMPAYPSAIPQLPPYTPREYGDVSTLTSTNTPTTAVSATTQTLLPPSDQVTNTSSSQGGATGIPRSNVVRLPEVATEDGH